VYNNSMTRSIKGFGLPALNPLRTDQRVDRGKSRVTSTRDTALTQWRQV